MREPFEQPYHTNHGDLSEEIERARKEREGPPQDPWAAAYPHVVTLACRMLSATTTSERKQEALVANFSSLARRIVEGATGHSTFQEQLAAVQGLVDDAPGGKLDLRSQRGTSLPEPPLLLRAYGEMLPALQQEFERDCSREDLRAHVSLLHPDLAPEVIAEAIEDNASHATHVILGSRYGRSWQRVRDVLTEARKESHAKQPPKSS